MLLGVGNSQENETDQMTRTLMLNAIRCGRFLQGNTMPIDYVIVSLSIAVLAAIIGEYLG